MAKKIGKEKDLTFVTDHAVVRYLERIKGLDITKIKEEMLEGSILDHCSRLGGNGLYPAKKCKLRMKNFRIVTVIKP